MIKLYYFAALVDELGTAYEEIELPPKTATVADLLALLRARGGQWEKTFATGLMRITVNKRFAETGTPIADGDEIAFVSVRC
ncbi:MoaD/ThiS family protein [Thiobacter aerophilum]|uniref:MoaD/ThiS family protein n=1 Tax=Thiobacter aerophilum TaxID=3121275 RepID=A0ABV0ECH2_9BURK